MSRRKNRSKIVRSVAIASVGLSTCSDNGAVDPVPPPLRCDIADRGQTLSATATINSTAIRVEITTSTNVVATFREPVTIRDLVGVRLVEALLAGSLRVIVDLELEDPDATTAQFTLDGLLANLDTFCRVTRVFTITIDNGRALVSEVQKRLPLGRMENAAIILVRREGLTVELETRGVAENDRVSWTVNAGEATTRARDGILWQLPSEPGIYRAEVLVDGGDTGFGFDTLALEVT